MLVNTFALVTFLVLACTTTSDAKIYGKCELVKALKKQGVPKNQLGTWVCIAQALSGFNTQAVNYQTNDYGMFQINSEFWCQVGNEPNQGCGISCRSLLDDDITNDIICARHIYETTEAEGQKPGFKAWAAWQQSCSGNNQKWLSGC